MSGPETSVVFSPFYSRLSHTTCMKEDVPTEPEVRDGWSKRPSNQTSGLAQKVQLAFRKAWPLTE